MTRSDDLKKRDIFAEKLDSISIPSNLSPDEQQKRIDLLKLSVKALLPKSLYRFRVCSELTVSAFDKDELWVSTADCMNDGFDTRIYIDKKEVEEQINDFIFCSSEKSKVLSNIPDLSNYPQQFSLAKEIFLKLSDDDKEKTINEIIKWITIDTAEALLCLPSIGQQTTKFCCFSERIHSPLMWGIYASNESGFALEYDFSQIPYASSPNIYSRVCTLFPVIYGEQRFQIPTNYVLYILFYRLFKIAIINSGLFHSNLDFANSFLASGICPDNLMVTKISLHKSIEWEKEAEWRLFCTSINDPVFQSEKHSCCIKKPKALYLGRRISSINEKILKKIAEEKTIPVYKMALDDNSATYELQIK